MPSVPHLAKRLRWFNGILGGLAWGRQLCRCLGVRHVPEAKEHLQAEQTEGEMVKPRLVLAEEARVRVSLQILVPVDYKHPGGRREVARVSRDVPRLEVLMPTGGPDRKPKVQEGKLHIVRPIPDEEVVRRDVPVVRNATEWHEHRGHLGQELHHHPASTREGARAEGGPREGPLQDLRDINSLQAVLINPVEPLVEGPPLELRHGHEDFATDFPGGHGTGSRTWEDVSDHTMRQVLRHPLQAVGL
mmetsp:Transcript_82283/g.218327  ORF Transcript_82283/g.218327 Transcript_82283/m.218327 type:complete len:246 (-) Transcript_82283:177-914(-)